MPLDGYGVLIGSVIDRRREGGAVSPHYQVQARAVGADSSDSNDSAGGGGASTDYRIAINVLSAQAPSELLFLAVDVFDHPVLDVLASLPDGFRELESRPQSGALDFVRGNLFDPADMRPLPPDRPGPDNDLSDRLEHYVARARSDPSARIFAFGQRWGPDAQPDQVFGFAPGNGIHDIHMNQGNSGAFVRDDGVWQDGALLFRFGDAGAGAPQWSAVFLAFQSQSWHTDDDTGHTLPGRSPTERAPLRVIAALVNPAGPAPEPETVTLLNAGPDDADLSGWTLADAAKNRFALHGTVAAGAALAVPVGLPFQLGNGGGAVTLLDPAGSKVDGVAYTGEQAADEGWTVVFR